MPICALTDVLQYRNDAVVRRFMETWDLPRDTADDLFEETKKWLWLSATLGDETTLAVSQSTKLIDEMWHTFILFTDDYSRFCDSYFGFYVHHRPTPQSEYESQIAAYETDQGAYLTKLEDQFSVQYELIYDHLGEATLVKWYDTYLERYTDEFLRSIWRWSFSPYDTRVRDSFRIASDAVPVAAPTQPGVIGNG